VKIEILDQAEQDLVIGFEFYEGQAKGLGSSFLTCLYTDIDALVSAAGIHRKIYRAYHRLLSKRFPFAIFYTVERIRHTCMQCWIVVNTPPKSANACDDLGRWLCPKGDPTQPQKNYAARSELGKFC
jgi:hypothetical protein